MLGRGEVPHADLVARSSLRSWLTAREAPEIDAALLAAAEAAARDAPAQEEWDLRGYSAGAVRFDDPCLVGVPPERAAASAAAGARSLVLTSSTSLARLPVAPLRRLVAEQLAKAGPLAVQLETSRERLIALEVALLGAEAHCEALAPVAGLQARPGGAPVPRLEARRSPPPPHHHHHTSPRLTSPPPSRRRRGSSGSFHPVLSAPSRLCQSTSASPLSKRPWRPRGAVWPRRRHAPCGSGDMPSSRWPRR